MKKLLGCFLCVMLLAFGAQAHALLITPESAPQWSGPETSTSEINAIILGITGSSVELYKQEVDDGVESGILAGSYETEFFNTPTDPTDATITYTGGPIVGIPAYLLVKDGFQDPEGPIPAWYLFELATWDGMDTLLLKGFWPDQGAISHVSLYGNQQSVPEPATMLLLGFGLIGLAGFGRKKLIKK